MSYHDEALMAHLDGETGSWRKDEEGVDTVLARLEEATQALSGWREARAPGGGVPTGAAHDLARAYALLRNSARYVPDVVGWGVGYRWGQDQRAWSCFTAHVAIADAERFRDAWEAKAGRRDGRRSETWIVRFCPCSITHFVHPGADAERYVAESGAFDR